MTQTIEALVDEGGQVHLLQPVTTKGVHRALVTILDEPPRQILPRKGDHCTEQMDELFGIWRDHAATACVDEYMRELRQGRF